MHKCSLEQLLKIQDLKKEMKEKIKERKGSNSKVTITLKLPNQFQKFFHCRIDTG